MRLYSGCSTAVIYLPTVPTSESLAPWPRLRCCAERRSVCPVQFRRRRYDQVWLCRQTSLATGPGHSAFLVASSRTFREHPSSAPMRRRVAAAWTILLRTMRQRILGQRAQSNDGTDDQATDDK